MAIIPISDLPALGAAPSTSDVFVLVDVSEDATVKLTTAELFTAPTMTTVTIASGGLTVDAGDTDVQALTATTGVFFGALSTQSGGVNISGTANPYVRLTDETGDGFVQVVDGDLNLTPRSGKQVTISGALTVAGALTASAGVVGTLTGNASTATALATARTINGTSFDGTANITVAAAAGTLTGSTLASGVTASSLTSLGTLTSLTTVDPNGGAPSAWKLGAYKSSSPFGVSLDPTHYIAVDIAGVTYALGVVTIS